MTEISCGNDVFDFTLSFGSCHCRVWRKWRSILYHYADLGKNRGKQCCFDDVHCVTVDLKVFTVVCVTFVLYWYRSPLLQALHCKNMQKARELWDTIMTKGNAKYANMWMEYYNLERSINHVGLLCDYTSGLCWCTASLTLSFTCRSYGDSAHCRKALHRAVQCTSDYPEHVCEVLLTFERVEGKEILNVCKSNLKSHWSLACKLRSK